MFYPFFGKKYEQCDIEMAVKENSYFLEFTFLNKESLFKDAAQEIANGKIIGWFQDGSECGPRALGNRSILADPRNKEMKDILNKKVKFREPFRPFAPAVLWEYQQEYFDLNIFSPYMLMVADVREDIRTSIPAVVHIDNTARVQSIGKDLMPKFYEIVLEFYKITNIPMLINTSFNVKGEPIVETPNDAIECLKKTELDFLYLGDYKIKKKRK